MCPGDDGKTSCLPCSSVPSCCVQRRHRKRHADTHHTDTHTSQRCCVLCGRAVRSLCSVTAKIPEGCATCLAMDSGLDAFSQYPSHGSFATPVARLIAETRGATRGFLSYYHVLPSSHPRVLLPHPKKKHITQQHQLLLLLCVVVREREREELSCEL